MSEVVARGSRAPNEHITNISTLKRRDINMWRRNGPVIIRSASLNMLSIYVLVVGARVVVVSKDTGRTSTTELAREGDAECKGSTGGASSAWDLIHSQYYSSLTQTFYMRAVTQFGQLYICNFASSKSASEVEAVSERTGNPRVRILQLPKEPTAGKPLQMGCAPLGGAGPMDEEPSTAIRALLQCPG
ncbi:hypothetical protein BDZ45DRAFT_798816 [Acephala macrosclerotiorum]|nr:hypothetical protein BDZ45DRAFT_798816 [Acephala macrosclerotiorum]